MATKLPNWLLKSVKWGGKAARDTGAFLQSGKGWGDLSSNDMSAVFSPYEDQSPLQSAFNQGQMPQAQFGRLQTPANPTIEGAPVAEIPRMERFPTGTGSWFSEATAKVMLQREQDAADFKKLEVAQAKYDKEQADINELLIKNPGLDKWPHTTIKEAQASLVKMKNAAIKEPLDALKKQGVELSNAIKKGTLEKQQFGSGVFDLPKSTGTVTGGGASKFSKTMKSGKVMISDDGENWRPK